MWWAVLAQSEVHDDAKALKLMRDQLVKIEGEGKENLVAYVKQRQMLPFLGHKTVKEWLQEHTDTSMMGRYKSKKGMPVLIDQSIFVLYSNRPLVRDS